MKVPLEFKLSLSIYPSKIYQCDGRLCIFELSYLVTNPED